MSWRTDQASSANGSISLATTVRRSEWRDAAGLPDENGAISVDVLKVQHHGSDRNTDRAFFDRVRARTYVISANGQHGNPDLETLEWIVDAADARGESIAIVVTNEASTLGELEASRSSGRSATD